MRKYLLPSALILLLGLGAVLAQNINKSLQLSQDPTGPIGIDTNFGAYFPGHILSAPLLAGRPQPTITGTGTPTISGSDTAGLITMGASATTAIAVFGQAFLSVPSCVATYQSPVIASTPLAYTIFATSLSITQPSSSSQKINYICLSVN